MVVLNPQSKGGCNYHNQPQKLNSNQCFDLQKLWLWLIDDNVSWYKVDRYYLICIIGISICLVNKNLT